MAGPYVKAALFCEDVIEGKDNILSFIKVVDRVTSTVTGPQAPAEMPPLQYRLKLVIGLISGDALGRHDIRIDIIGPDGLRRPGPSMTVQLEGGIKGNNLILDSTFQFTSEGPHWFEVSFDNEPITRTPLEVIYQRVQPFSPPSR